LFGCVLLLSALLPGRARAGDDYVESDSRVAARVLAAQGAEAYERRDFALALSLFERAGAIIQAPTITLMEARSLVELGRLVEALEMYGATQRMLGIDPTNEVFRQAADAAARETEALLQRIPTLRVRLSGADAKPKVEIEIDGKKIMPALAAVDRPIDPGPHRIEAVAGDGSRASRDITIAEGAHEDVELSLSQAPVAVVAPVPPPPLPRETPSSSRTLGWVIGGTGGAFTVLGAITGVLALDKKSELDRVCNPGCPPAKAGDISAFRRDRTLSYVGFGLGALGLAGGAYLLWLAPSDKVALGVAPGFVALAGAIP
jgi:hypothetical protein